MTFKPSLTQFSIITSLYSLGRKGVETCGCNMPALGWSSRMVYSFVLLLLYTGLIVTHKNSPTPPPLIVKLMGNSSPKLVFCYVQGIKHHTSLLSYYIVGGQQWKNPDLLSVHIAFSLKRLSLG